MSRDPLLFPQQPEEEVFRAHVGVTELSRFGHRELQHLLGTRCVGELAERDGGLPLFHRFLDLFVNLVEIDAQVREHRRSDSFALTDEAEENVFGAHVIVLEADGLFSGHRKHFSNSVGEIVIHALSLLSLCR